MFHTCWLFAMQYQYPVDVIQTVPSALYLEGEGVPKGLRRGKGLGPYQYTDSLDKQGNCEDVSAFVWDTNNGAFWELFIRKSRKGCGSLAVLR